MVSSRVYADLFAFNGLNLVEKIFEKSNVEFQQASRHDMLDQMVDFLEQLLEINGINVIPFLTAVHDVLDTSHLCDDDDDDDENDDMEPSTDPVERAADEENARLRYLRKISLGRNLKRNCLFIYGESDAGKSLLANLLTSGHQCTSLVQSSKTFALASLVGPFNCGNIAIPYVRPYIYPFANPIL